MVPWEFILNNPSFGLYLLIGWLLWQIYVPRLVNRLVGRDRVDDFLYDTWWSSVKTEFKSEFERIDQRVDDAVDNVQHIADTQEDLKKVTVAQTHMMNGHEGDIDVQAVEDELLNDTDEKQPHDYLSDD